MNSPKHRLNWLPKDWRTLSWTAIALVLLQSACTAVLALSGVRVAIGLTALAAAGGTFAPAKGLHADAIRIPMLTISVIAALINLFVLFRVWKLRARAGKWRKREVSAEEKRSERLQFTLAIITLILAGFEVWTHPMVHKKLPASIVQTLHISLKL